MHRRNRNFLHTSAEGGKELSNLDLHSPQRAQSLSRLLPTACKMQDARHMYVHTYPCPHPARWVNWGSCGSASSYG